MAVCDLLTQTIIKLLLDEKQLCWHSPAFRIFVSKEVDSKINFKIAEYFIESAMLVLISRDIAQCIKSKLLHQYSKICGSIISYSTTANFNQVYLQSVSPCPPASLYHDPQHLFLLVSQILCNESKFYFTFFNFMV